MGLLNGAREVFVRITGKEDVSAAAGKAGASLQSLGKQAKQLLENQLVQGIGFAGMVAGLGKAVEEANALEASTRKLEATAKITGTSLDTLTQVAGRGKDAFKLSTVLANDFATELGKLSEKAGDVGKAAPGMEAFLDIGAARGLGAAETLQAVKQAILGIDEGTDKLFNKNPSAIYQEYAEQIGISAAKLTDQQKAQALLNEALEDGAKVRGEYAVFLETTAGKQQQLTVALQESAAQLGKALSPAVQGFLPVLQGFVEGLGAFVGGIQLMAVDAAYFFEQIPNTVVLIKGKTLEQLGLLLKGAGDFIPFFGQKVSALGESLIAEGQRQVQQSKDYTAVLLQVREEAEQEIVGVVQKSGASQVDHIKKSGAAGTKVVSEELKKRRKAEEDEAKALKAARDKWNAESIAQLEGLGKAFGVVREQQVKDAEESAKALAEQLGVSLGKASADAIDLTTEAMGRLLEKLKGKIPTADWEALNTKLQEHKSRLSDLLPPADELAQSVEDAKDYAKGLNEALPVTKDKAGEAADKAGVLARALLDAGTATGAIDDDMAATLTSVINIATALPKALGGDITSIGGVVAGLASLISGWGNNAAYRAQQDASRKNTLALQELTAEFGDYNGSASGRVFQGVSESLNDALASASSDGRPPNIKDVEQELKKRGLTISDARKLADKFGIDVDKDPYGWYNLAVVLGSRKYGSPEGNFTDELSSIEEAFGVLGVTDADNKLVQFRDFIKDKVPALAGALAGDLTTEAGRKAAIASLRQIYTDSINGKIKPEQYGRATAQQFRQIIATLLPILGDANGVMQNGLPATGPDTIGDGPGPNTGGPSPAGIGPGGGPGPSTGGPSIGTSALNFSPGLPSLVNGTSGIGAPAISGNIVPAPSTQTTINGGVTVTINLPDVTNSREAAELVAAQVADILGADYTRQRTALGLAS